MASKWGAATIKDVAEKVGMGPFGSSIKVDTFVSDGVPIIGSKHLHKFKMDDAQPFKFITPDHAQRLANSNVVPGDIILTHRGSIGQVSYIPQDSQYTRYVISQSQFYMRCDRTKVIPEYVTMYFKSPEGRHQLLANTSQVGVPAIAQPVTYLRTIVIPLPPLEEQRHISHILGTLDDKIELNRRMNTTLEGMARALFKSWFVDFEPVRAKMEGRWRRGESLPGMPAELYDLFPERLAPSELGEVPEGWRKLSLNEVAEYKRGSVSPSKQSRELFEHYSIPAFDKGEHPSVDLGENIKSNKTIVPLGAVLLSKLNPHISRVWIPDSLSHRIQIASTEFLPFTPRPPVGQGLLYCLFRSVSFQMMLESMVTGTSRSHQRVQPKALLGCGVVTGDFPLFQEFETLVAPILTCLLANRLESRSLTLMRDTLLPRMVAGSCG